MTADLEACLDALERVTAALVEAIRKEEGFRRRFDAPVEWYAAYDAARDTLRDAGRFGAADELTSALNEKARP